MYSNNTVKRVGKQNPVFSSTYRIVRDSDGRMIYRTTTEAFRGDLNWLGLADRIIDMCTGGEKVNIFVSACSSGEEAWTLALSLLTRSLKRMVSVANCFPIIAKDLDEENIISAKSGSIFVSENEKKYMSLACDSALMKYIDFTPVSVKDYNDYLKYRKEDGYIATFAPCLRNLIKFSQGNILQDVSEIPNHKTILTCRNMWPYLTKVNQVFLMKQIAEKFQDGSNLLVLGDYDYEGDLSGTLVTNLLDKYNFEQTSLHNVYQK